MEKNSTEMDPGTVKQFIGDIYYMGADGNFHTVKGGTYTITVESWASDTTDDGTSGTPEFELPLGSKWIKLPHKVHGAPVWERLG